MLPLYLLSSLRTPKMSRPSGGPSVIDSEAKQDAELLEAVELVVRKVEVVGLLEEMALADALDANADLTRHHDLQAQRGAQAEAELRVVDAVVDGHAQSYGS